MIGYDTIEDKLKSYERQQFECLKQILIVRRQIVEMNNKCIDLIKQEMKKLFTVKIQIKKNRDKVSELQKYICKEGEALSAQKQCIKDKLEAIKLNDMHQSYYPPNSIPSKIKLVFQCITYLLAGVDPQIETDKTKFLKNYHYRVFHRLLNKPKNLIDNMINYQNYSNNFSGINHKNIRHVQKLLHDPQLDIQSIQKMSKIVGLFIRWVILIIKMFDHNQCSQPIRQDKLHKQQNITNLQSNSYQVIKQINILFIDFTRTQSKKKQLQQKLYAQLIK